MKKLLTLLLFVFAIASMNAQPAKSTPLLDEGFEGTTFPPTGWTQQQTGAMGAIPWMRAATNTPPPNNAPAEVVYTGVAAAYNAQQGWASATLITPKLSIPQTGSYVLEFMFFLNPNNIDNIGPVNSVMVSTTGATGPFTAIDTLPKIYGSYQKRVIPLEAYAGSDIYIAFRQNKETAGWFDLVRWYMDDVKVYDVSAYTDMEIVQITSPVSAVNMGTTEEVTVLIRNNSGRTISDFDLQLVCEELSIDVTETYTLPIPSLGTATYTFGQKLDLSEGGFYTITVTAHLNGDENPDNDSKTVTIFNTICEPLDISEGWFEGFEDPAWDENPEKRPAFPFGCWNYYGEIAPGAVPYWNFTRWSGGGHTGTFSLQHMYFTKDTLSSWAVSPQFTIPETEEYIFQFWAYIIEIGGTIDASYEVWVSTAGNDPTVGDDFKKVYTLEQERGVWKRNRFPLDDFAGETIFIAFKTFFEGEDAPPVTGWTIDDLTIIDPNAPEIYRVNLGMPDFGRIEVRLMSDESLVTTDIDVLEGTELILSAFPEHGYEFAEWFDGVTTPELNRTYTVTGDVTINAVFEPEPPYHSISIATSPNGTITVMNGSTPVTSGTFLPEGTVLTLTANANTDFEFEKWWDNNVTNPRQYTLEGPVSISATFKQDVSIAETLNTASLQVFPNPVTDILNIQTDEIIKQIVVLDLSGKIVLQVNGDNKTINLKSLPTGNYVVRIHTETAITPIKIVKK
jgi:hypothetical protein